MPSVLASALSMVSSSPTPKITKSSTKSLGYRAIISERVNTTSHLSGGLKDGISRFLVKLLYKRADNVVAVSEGVKADLIENYAVPEPKVSLLYNPYDIAQLHELASEAVTDIPKAPYIIGVGRLVKNKNFSLLLNAYAKADIVEELPFITHLNGYISQ